MSSRFSVLALEYKDGPPCWTGSLKSRRTSPVGHTLGLVALVCAAGMALGSLKVKGIGLGSSGVLFMGILAAQFSEPPDAQMLTFVKEFGLVLFVFTIGLQLGPGFFASLRAEGLRLNILAAVLVLSAGVLAPLVGWLGGFDPEAIGGSVCWSHDEHACTRRGPAVARVDAGYQRRAPRPAGAGLRRLVSGGDCRLAGRHPGDQDRCFASIRCKEAASDAAERRQATKPLLRRTLVVEKPEMWPRFSRAAKRASSSPALRRAGEAEVQTAQRETGLRLGDTILAVGTEALLDQLERLIGRRSDEDLLTAPGKVTFRRIAVTHRRALGKTVAELGFEERLGVEVTRIVRGDVEMTAVPSLRLQFGDVLQVVGPEEQLEKAAELLGNSLKKLNETQFIPLFAGIFLGVLVGSIPLAVPGLSNPLRLGLAGGPLIVALALGRIGHIGGLVWHMPLNANHAFREFGISLFFAALGLAAGDQFFDAVFSPRGLSWLVAGLVITLVPLLAVGIWSRAVEKMNFVTLSGLLAGGTTNPPALSFATNLCRSDAPTLAYATVYPLTTLLRILVAQVLTLVLCN